MSGRNASRGAQDSCESSLVCDQCETTTIDVLVELTNAIDQRQSFLLQLRIVIVTGLQHLRSTNHWVFCAVWKNMHENRSNFKPGCISCMPDGFVTFGRNLPILEWNSAAVLLLKMPSQTSI